jgi:hypothetical protein
MLTLPQILHVHRHNDPHRELAHPDRGFHSGLRQSWPPRHHEEAVGAEDEAGSGGVEGSSRKLEEVGYCTRETQAC